MATSTCVRFTCSMQIERYHLHVICLVVVVHVPACATWRQHSGETTNNCKNNTVQKHEGESCIHNTCMTIFTGVWPIFYPAWSCMLDTYREWK